MDDLDQAAILEVQLQDIDELLKKPVGSSFKQTLLVQQEELQGALSIIRDRQMCKSISRAVLQDATAIKAFIEQEQLVENDRAFASRLAGVEYRPPILPTPPATSRSGTPTSSRAPVSSAPGTQANSSNSLPTPSSSLRGSLAPSPQPSTPTSNASLSHSAASNANKIRTRSSAKGDINAASSPHGTHPNGFGAIGVPRITGPQNGPVPRFAVDTTASTKRPLDSSSASEEPSTKRRVTGQPAEDTKNVGNSINQSPAEGSSTMIPTPSNDPTKRSLETADGLNTKRVDIGATKIASQTKSPKESIAPTREPQTPLAEPNFSATPRLSGPSFGQVSCVSCGDIFYPFSTAKMVCEHVYCQACLQTLVKNSLVDERLFPPRCCKQPFLMDNMRKLLTPDLISGYWEKKIELETRDRTYCSAPSCSTFLHPVNISADQKLGTCPVCFVGTCTICKGSEHDGDCPKDDEIQKVLDLAKQEGWRRCTECGRVVELKTGCNHITCICKSEWCYFCGAPWKTCQCVQWDEDRLIERAQVVANREQPGPAAPAQIHTARQDLEQRHNCNHTHWARVSGDFDCEDCNSNN
ncbi:hypothetical protein G7Y89_g7949 [Cudoniella acicularis]|uniref:RBR-type E3 ubiquitin transferase n=1 Tax=Cudoniella acicularis TaxID=354080 RepID=A0A8H4W122_9HELO|nr:hypothetical protein G7Y89_g7949 [Cudoniella acicularis]